MWVFSCKSYIFGFCRYYDGKINDFILKYDPYLGYHQLVENDIVLSSLLRTVSKFKKYISV